MWDLVFTFMPVHKNLYAVKVHEQSESSGVSMKIKVYSGKYDKSKFSHTTKVVIQSLELWEKGTPMTITQYIIQGIFNTF